MTGSEDTCSCDWARLNPRYPLVARIPDPRCEEHGDEPCPDHTYDIYKERDLDV